jgi:hypothetical protein
MHITPQPSQGFEEESKPLSDKLYIGCLVGSLVVAFLAALEKQGAALDGRTIAGSFGALVVIIGLPYITAWVVSYKRAKTLFKKTFVIAWVIFSALLLIGGAAQPQGSGGRVVAKPLPPGPSHVGFTRRTPNEYCVGCHAQNSTEAPMSRNHPKKGVPPDTTTCFACHGL